jgi:hypothetical protein
MDFLDSAPCIECKQAMSRISLNEFGLCRSCVRDYEPNFEDLATKIRWLQYMIDTNRGSSTNELAICAAAGSLRHNLGRGSQTLIKVTIGEQADADLAEWMQPVDKGRLYGDWTAHQMMIAARTRHSDAPPTKAFLRSGMEVRINAVYDTLHHGRYVATIKVDEGECFSRRLKTGETLWMTRQDFDEFFYPFTYRDEDGKQWRVPLTNLEAALAHISPPTPTQENDHGN